jgi:hypothetical protein
LKMWTGYENSGITSSQFIASGGYYIAATRCSISTSEVLGKTA